MLNGIDVSNWQKTTPRGYSFYIIKASEGVGYQDPLLAMHLQDAKNFNALFGFYHYARPDLGNTAEAEADYFIKVVQRVGGLYAGILALDFEGKALGVKNAQSWALAFLARVYEKTGVRPLLYVQGSGAAIAQAAYKQNFGIWAASSPTYYTRKGISLAMQQNVSDNLDHDVFYGDGAAWKAYAADSRQTAADTQQTAAKKSNEEIAKEVIAGRWGNGDSRKQALTAAGYDYEAIQKIVNEKLSGKKSIDEIAREVIAGKWGNVPQRKQRLTKAGYDFAAVQKRVNELMKKA